MAISVAVFASRFLSLMLRSTFSMTTIASSTTRPIARTIAKSVSVLIENPRIRNEPKVAIRDTGTASIGIIVARQLCRNTNTITITRSSASKKVSATSNMDAFMKSVVSLISTYSISGGKSRLASSMTFLTPLTVSIALASFVSIIPKPIPTLPSVFDSTEFVRAPSSMRAISLRRTKEPFAPERTITFPKSSAVTRRPATLPVYCFSCISGAGIIPTVPAGACIFCSCTADVTSATVSPSSAKRSGFNHTRME